MWSEWHSGVLSSGHSAASMLFISHGDLCMLFIFVFAQTGISGNVIIDPSFSCLDVMFSPHSQSLSSFLSLMTHFIQTLWNIHQNDTVTLITRVVWDNVNSSRQLCHLEIHNSLLQTAEKKIVWHVLVFFPCTSLYTCHISVQFHTDDYAAIAPDTVFLIV